MLRLFLFLNHNSCFGREETYAVKLHGFLWRFDRENGLVWVVVVTYKKKKIQNSC